MHEVELVKTKMDRGRENSELFQWSLFGCLSASGSVAKGATVYMMLDAGECRHAN